MSSKRREIDYSKL